MTWTYDPSLPSVRDKIRFDIQDTDTNDQLVSNEEINITLTDNGSNRYRTSAALCRSIALQLGRRPHIREAHASLSSQEQYEHYMALAMKLDQKAVATAAGVFAGGVSVADMDARKDDTDRPPPAFTTDLHNAP